MKKHRQVVSKDRFEMVPLAEIADNPYQVGFPPDEPEVVRAAYQIRDQGLAFPILVRPWGRLFQLASGQRWLSACRLLGAAKVPSLIRALDDRTMATFAFEEAALRGTISQGHADVLLDATGNVWISNLLQRLRGGEEGYRVQADPEAARNLPLLQSRIFTKAGAAAPQAYSAEPALVLPIDEAAGPAPAPVDRGIHDTLLGIRCRRIPALWFQTVSEPGRRWLLESTVSAGLIEISACLGGGSGSAPTWDGASTILRGILEKRHPGIAPAEIPGGEKGRGGVLELEVHDRAADLKHRYVLLWKPGRAVLFHLSNAPRFFLYDLRGFQEMIETAELA